MVGTNVGSAVGTWVAVGTCVGQAVAVGCGVGVAVDGAGVVGTNVGLDVGMNSPTPSTIGSLRTMSAVISTTMPWKPCANARLNSSGEFTERIGVVGTGVTVGRSVGAAVVG